SIHTLRTVFGGITEPGGGHLLGEFRGWVTAAGPSRFEVAAGEDCLLQLAVGTKPAWGQPLPAGTYQILAHAEVLVDGPPQRHAELRAVGPLLKLLDYRPATSARNGERA
ncbi:MAG: hypothetical protein ACYCUG_14970, partial [Acidimicrobiales bacterium]